MHKEKSEKSRSAKGVGNLRAGAAGLAESGQSQMDGGDP